MAREKNSHVRNNKRKVKDNRDALYNPKPFPPASITKSDKSEHKLSTSLARTRDKYHNLPLEKKLERLGRYSLCKFQSCACKGHKLQSDNGINTESQVQSNDNEGLNAICTSCQHTLLDHCSHLQNCSEDCINNLLNTVVDLEYLYYLHVHHNKGDQLTLRVYTVLCKLLRDSVAQMTKPQLGGILKCPPFEPISIAQGMRSFIIYKFSAVEENDFQNVYKYAQILLKYINDRHLIEVNKFEMLTKESQSKEPTKDLEIYKLHYARWLCYCNVPQTYKSFKHYDIIDAFGLKFLKMIYKYFQRDIIDKIKKDSNDSEVGEWILRLFSVLGKELDDESSPMWTNVESTINNHVIPLNIVPMSYAAAFPEKKFEAAKGSLAEVTKFNFLSDITPSPPDLPNGVPEDVIIDALHNLKDPGRMFGPYNLTEEEPRGEKAREEEQRGAFEIHVVANSVSTQLSKQCLIYLVGLQNLFTHLLPEIPTEYITRYVFDTKHRNLAIVQENEVIGGICFRMFPEQDFSEIVFCGVSVNKQVRGYGSHMMNHLKDYHIKHNIHHLLTYADNFAIQYFEKQGFAETISLQKSMYDSYIKEYDKAQLMECKLDPNIRYVDLSKVLQMQISIVKSLSKKFRDSNPKMYPGLNYFSEGVKEIPVQNLDGVVDSKKPDRKHKKTEKDQEELEEKLRLVFNQIRTHDCSWPFQMLMNRNEFPEYYELVKNPLDFETVAHRLNVLHCYTTPAQFNDDMLLIFQNCRSFSSKNSESHKCAAVLEKIYLAKFREVGLFYKKK